MRAFPTIFEKTELARVSDVQNTVRLSSKTLQDLYDGTTTNEFIGPVVDKMVRDTVGRDIMIKIEGFGEEHILSSTTMAEIRDIFYPLAKELFRYLNTVGFVFCMFKEGLDSKKRNIPSLLPFEKITIEFIESTVKVRQYIVYDKATNDALEGLFIVQHEPDYRGNVTAPITMVLPLANLTVQCRQWSSYSEFQRTHVPWVFQSSGKGAEADPLKSNEWDQGELNDLAEDERITQQDRETKKVEETVKQWESLHKEFMRQMGTSMPPLEMSTPPWKYRFVLPHSLTLATPPMPSGTNLFIEMIEIVSNLVYTILGVPPFLMSCEVAKVKAQSEQTLVQYYDTVIGNQNQLARMLEQIFYVAKEAEWYTLVYRMHTKAKSTAKQIVETTKDTKISKSMLSDMKKQLEEETKRQEEEQNVNVLPAASEELKRAGRILTLEDSELAGIILASIKLVISFDVAPMVNPENLDKLKNEGAMKMDDYLKILARQSGISNDLLLLGEDRDKELKKRQDESMAVELKIDQQKEGMKRTKENSKNSKAKKNKPTT